MNDPYEGTYLDQWLPTRDNSLKDRALLELRLRIPDLRVVGNVQFETDRSLQVSIPWEYRHIFDEIYHKHFFNAF